MSKSFLNFTDLPETEAKELMATKRKMVLRGESGRMKRVTRDEENINLWLNNIWSDEELDNFFKEFDLTPYKIGVHRPLINNLISKQRSRKISFDFVPSDIHAYKRHRRGREQFIEEEMGKEDTVFGSPQEAGEYYDHYADDEYANAVTALLHNIRQENKSRFVETEVFQQGLITGLDFFKCVYGRKWNRNGGVEITRRPQRAIFYDESSVEYDLHDIEYIGEVHRLYKNQLKVQYPDYANDIEEFFQQFTNKNRPINQKELSKWRYFYDFNYTNDTEARLKVAEIWCLESEDRFVVVDNETNETKVVEYGVEEDDIYDNLMSMMLIELQDQASRDPEVEDMLAQPNVKEQIAEMVENRFDIETTTEPIWYKTVFSYNCLFEHTRSPLPHGSHPYFPFFAQFTEGEFSGIMDDIKDLVLGINKALAFRELMMSHGAKGLVLIDEKSFADSGYSVEDVADHYSSVGGLMAMKLRPGVNLQDIISVVTTVGDGLEAINSILADLDQRLLHVSGVTMEQLGVVQRQTTHSGYRAQVAEGEVNNGLIFDNFYRSMESFYNDKVIPMVVDMMENQSERVIRRLGDGYHPWIEISPEDDFGFFADAVRTGQYNTVLRPITDNVQIQEERAAKYMELAMAGLLDPEIAIEFSPDPDRFKLLKKMKEKEIERARRAAFSEFSMQEFYQAAAESNLPMESVEALIEEIKRERMKTMGQDSGGQQTQRRQGGMGQLGSQSISQEASESQRLGQIERTEQ